MFVLFSFPFRIAKNASRYMYTIYHLRILVIILKFILGSHRVHYYCLYCMRIVYMVSQILIRSTFVFQISSEVQVTLNPYYTVDYHNRIPNNKTAKMHFYLLFFIGHAQRSRSVLCENCVQANSSFSNVSLLQYSVLNNKP